MPSSASHHGGAAKGHTGAVKDPEHDKRLKENRDQGVHKAAQDEKASTSKAPHKRTPEEHRPGAVKSADDGRLKENRDKGIHKGDG